MWPDNLWRAICWYCSNEKERDSTSVLHHLSFRDFCAAVCKMQRYGHCHCVPIPYYTCTVYSRH